MLQVNLIEKMVDMSRELQQNVCATNVVLVKTLQTENESLKNSLDQYQRAPIRAL